MVRLGTEGVAPQKQFHKLLHEIPNSSHAYVCDNELISDICTASKTSIDNWQNTARVDVEQIRGIQSSKMKQ